MWAGCVGDTHNHSSLHLVLSTCRLVPADMAVVWGRSGPGESAFCLLSVLSNETGSYRQPCGHSTTDWRQSGQADPHPQGLLIPKNDKGNKDCSSLLYPHTWGQCQTFRAPQQMAPVSELDGAHKDQRAKPSLPREHSKDQVEHKEGSDDDERDEVQPVPGSS